MTSRQIVRSYIDFFVKRGHKEIPSSSLIPENDPTVLFTTAGMHPLVPYLLGQQHPLGKRLVNLQKCLRTDDIEEVGDETHCTFFEMLGNWSLGDYFKQDAISWSFEFLTQELHLPLEKIYVSCFEGDKDAPKDSKSAEIWESLGISRDHIFFYPKNKNWWGPAGITGPCGPDTEIFYETEKEHPLQYGQKCHPNCQCGKFVEIWNNVFMEYNKTSDGEYAPLAQKNVDTGMGLERITTILEKVEDVFQTDLFKSIIVKIESLTKSKDIKSERIIADHIRAAVFVVADGIRPSNTERGYVLRRLIRRAIRHGKILGIEKPFLSEVAELVVENYKDSYAELLSSKKTIVEALKSEEEKFNITLKSGIKEFEKIYHNSKNNIIAGKDAFLLYESYGFPIELTQELARDKKMTVDIDDYENMLKKHQELSRTVAKKKFKGGLADNSENTTKLHTATHLLHKSLRIILGDHISQEGSNITPERLRFDFSHTQKLTPEEINKVEDLVNQKINENLNVTQKTLPLKKALESGALAFFGERYPELVKVYSIGDFSEEVCGGPHVTFTGELKSFKITKEESAGSGIRRIYAVVGN